MTSNQCLNSSASHFSKFIVDDRVDGTRSTQNLSKFCENCRLVKEELEAEIFSLKDKAHQSFMQVIQVQQLHEEQVELIKQQHQDEVTVLREQNSKLQQYVSKTKQDILLMQKNSKRYTIDIEPSSFFIEDNIDIIRCSQEDGKQNKLDESSYVQFHELISQKNIQEPNSNIFSKTSEKNRNLQIEEKLLQLKQRIVELQAENETLWLSNQQLKKECLKNQNNSKTLKQNYDSLYKESKFMSDHIRTLSNQKFKLQKKVKELQKQIKASLKKSTVISDEKNPVKIQVNGIGLFGSSENDMVRNSLQTSKDSKDSNQSKTLVVQSLNFEDAPFRSNKQVRYLGMAKSDVFTRQQDKIQGRKSIPNYKKINHIPSFKKVTSDQKESRFEQMIKKKQDPSFDEHSNIIEDLQRQIQLKQTMKKSHGLFNHQYQKHGFFRENQKKSTS